MQGEWSDDDLQHDMSEGRWVAENLNVVPRTTVGSLVPAGFEAYARILYPVRRTGPDGKRALLRWSEIARHTGAIVHAKMELHAIESKRSQANHSEPPTQAAPVTDWPEQLSIIAA